MKGDDISDHFLMLWFQKDSLDTVCLRTYGGGSRLPVLNVPMEGRVTFLGLSPTDTMFLPPFLKAMYEGGGRG